MHSQSHEHWEGNAVVTIGDVRLTLTSLNRMEQNLISYWLQTAVVRFSQDHGGTVNLQSQITYYIYTGHRFFSNEERDSWETRVPKPNGPMLIVIKVTLFIVDYKGCYDNNMWRYIVLALYVMTASVASSSAVAAYYTEQKNTFNWN